MRSGPPTNAGPSEGPDPPAKARGERSSPTPHASPPPSPGPSAARPPSHGPGAKEPVKDQGLPTLPRGATIGRYVVLGLVGRGGMGEVYAAYDPELDRKVAVKLLRVKPGNGVSRNEGRQRTLREAQAIARLSHPNVVVVFDVGTFVEIVRHSTTSLPNLA